VSEDSTWCPPVHPLRCVPRSEERGSSPGIGTRWPRRLPSAARERRRAPYARDTFPALPLSPTDGSVVAADVRSASGTNPGGLERFCSVNRPWAQSRAFVSFLARKTYRSEPSARFATLRTLRDGLSRPSTACGGTILPSTPFTRASPHRRERPWLDPRPPGPVWPVPMPSSPTRDPRRLGNPRHRPNRPRPPPSLGGPPRDRAPSEEERDQAPSTTDVVPAGAFPPPRAVLPRFRLAPTLETPFLRPPHGPATGLPARWPLDLPVPSPSKERRYRRAAAPRQLLRLACDCQGSPLNQVGGYSLFSY
jgi:hypothetical protein